LRAARTKSFTQYSSMPGRPVAPPVVAAAVPADAAVQPAASDESVQLDAPPTAGARGPSARPAWRQSCSAPRTPGHDGRTRQMGALQAPPSIDNVRWNQGADIAALRLRW